MNEEKSIEQGVTRGLGGKVGPDVAFQAPQKKTFAFPTEVISLPSKGLVYPESSPLSKGEVTIKLMTAKEEDILTSENYLKNGLTMDKLVESILVDKNLEADSIISIDKTAILIAARISAYGPKYKVVITCSKCSKETKINYNLIEQPTVKLAKEDLEITENGNFMINLPSVGWDVGCRLITTADEKRNNLNNDKTIDRLISNYLSTIIASINTVTDKEILQQAIEAMPMKDSKYLRDVYKDLIPNIKFGINFECEGCSHKQELEVPVTLDFFWPNQ